MNIMSLTLAPTLKSDVALSHARLKKRRGDCVCLVPSRSMLGSTVKLEFHGSSFIEASSSYPREDVVNIGRVGHVGRGCYENASDLSAISCACRARGIWRTTRHTDKRAAVHRNRPPTDATSSYIASSRGRRACRACL